MFLKSLGMSILDLQPEVVAHFQIESVFIILGQQLCSCGVRGCQCTAADLTNQGQIYFSVNKREV